ncbi:glutamate 5-kinase [Endomicrobium proavitum]|uniref:Glutamate 5-kinase n=1 Tax=Endomicrobium proavitum TaxID=1408281 RepID=A0A0G3WJX9_9BACT|nr:glutamate 5-kinase [Endomicrobium proavitum]AKL98200.1 gamma-glutamate kinase [Endomicrobium proavitum]
MKIVIKIGTSTLTDKNGLLNEKYISDLAQNIAGLQKNKHEVLLVSSGAISAGLGRLNIKKRPETLREKQALAAVGQPIVMDAYEKAFKKYGKTVAQILLTRDDFDNRVKYINARNTLSELVSKDIIPVINENDTIAVEEINFGDNDTLGALVAVAVKADKLIIFTDVDGLYDGHPSKGGKIISQVEKITSEIENFATSKSASGRGTGGMKTKVLAAKIAAASGVETVITNGSKLELLKVIVGGKNAGTCFKAKGACLEAKKSWIAFGKKSKGNIFVDKKAEEALVKKGKSLLAIGIVKTSGNFNRGNTVEILNDKGCAFARGLTNYSSAQIQKIKGKKTAEIKKLIDQTEDEVIHRDNLAIL